MLPDLIIGAITGGIFGFIIGFFAYRRGVLNERRRHFQWMSDGWDKCMQHLDWLRLTSIPGEDWEHQHLMYITDIFGAGRPYPIEKEKVGKEK